MHRNTISTNSQAGVGINGHREEDYAAAKTTRTVIDTSPTAQ